MTTIMIIAVLVVLAALRVPVALALFVAGATGSFLIAGDKAGSLIRATVTGSLSGYVLAAMLLALLLTGLARASGLSRHGFIGWRAMAKPSSGGGLVLTMLSMIIGASVGDSLDRNTAVAVRTPLGAAGYRQSSILGVLVGAAGLRFIVPISAVVVFAGIGTEQSIGVLMLALIIPAGIMSFVLLAVAGLSERYRRTPTPEAETLPADRRSVGYAFAGASLALFLIMLVSILVAGGLATPTEALGLAALIMLIYAVVVTATGGAKFADLFQGLVFAARKFGEIALILLGIMMIARAGALSGNTQALAEAGGNNPIPFLAAMLFALMIAAALLGALPAVGLAMATVYPSMINGGLDAIIAVILLLAAAASGQALPGVGRTSLFIRQCFDDVTIGQLARAALPYFIGTVIWFAILVMIIPAILAFARSFQ